MPENKQRKALSLLPEAGAQAQRPISEFPGRHTAHNCIHAGQNGTMPVSKKEISPCPIDAMLSVIDGRWKGTILWRLLDGPMRTGELRRSIPGITERMLIRHLRDLVADGILLRIEERTGLPQVRYSISPYGLTLLPVLQSICDWGRQHLARASFPKPGPATLNSTKEDPQ